MTVWRRGVTYVYHRTQVLASESCVLKSRSTMHALSLQYSQFIAFATCSVHVNIWMSLRILVCKCSVLTSVLHVVHHIAVDPHILAFINCFVYINAWMSQMSREIQPCIYLTFLAHTNSCFKQVCMSLLPYVFVTIQVYAITLPWYFGFIFRWRICAVTLAWSNSIPERQHNGDRRTLLYRSLKRSLQH